MRIAVYTIALNEARFVTRWANSAEDADYILIADTGSTDATVEQAHRAGVHVASIHIKPWRFDDARNAALALLPEDIDMCIALDMDEVLMPGWRVHLESVQAGTTRPRYKYVWSWQPDGAEGLVYGGDKIHRRSGYRWRHAVHETLTPTEPEVQQWTGLEIHHHPDNTKSRAQYFPLLEVARNETPQDDRTAYYYARELFYHGKYEQAIPEFKRYLELPTAVWRPERAAAMRYLGKMGHEPERWYTLATLEAPDRREPWCDLAQYAHDIKDWRRCRYAAERALEITEQQLEYLCEADAWGARPHDLLSIALYHCGEIAGATQQCETALSIAPHDARIAANLGFLRQC